MLSYTSNNGHERYIGTELTKASDAQLAQTLKYLAMGYSAQRVSELFGMHLSVTRVMKMDIGKYQKVRT